MGEDSKPSDEKPQNPPPKPTNDDDLEAEDFDFFIKDLQRIIDESPPAPGMQSQFARTISYLKEKKKTLKALGKLFVNEEKQELYRKVLKLVDGEIETQVYSEDRFQNVLQLVKMREELSERKAAETVKMPEKVFPKNGPNAVLPVNSPVIGTDNQKALQSGITQNSVTSANTTIPKTGVVEKIVINEPFAPIDEVILMGDFIPSKKENKSEMSGSSIDNAFDFC
jgi:hypothetical protein